MGVGISVILGSGVSVGVGCLGWGITVRTRPKIILVTTNKPSALKMICRLLLRERLIDFPPGIIILSFVHLRQSSLCSVELPAEEAGIEHPMKEPLGGSWAAL